MGKGGKPKVWLATFVWAAYSRFLFVNEFRREGPGVPAGEHDTKKLGDVAKGNE